MGSKAALNRISAFAMVLISTNVVSQGYPEKPVRVVVPYVAGGATDRYARIISKNLWDLMGQPFLVDNRPGAATIIGAQAATQAPKDGYTLFFTVSATFSANPHLYKKLPYSVENFAPIAIVGVSSGWTLSAHPSLPPRTVKELVAFVKARPGQVVIGTLGVGSGPYLVAKTFERLAGLKFVDVSYKGSADAIRDLLGGHIMMYSDGLAGALPLHNAGRLRIVAITGPRRSPLLPDVATLVENGYSEMALTNFWALYAPAGTSADIINKLHAAVVKATDTDSYRSILMAEAVTPETSTPADLAKAIRRDTETWRRLIAPLNIEPK